MRNDNMDRFELIAELENRMFSQYKNVFMPLFIDMGFTPSEGWAKYKSIVFDLIRENEGL